MVRVDICKAYPFQRWPVRRSSPGRSREASDTAKRTHFSATSLAFDGLTGGQAYPFQREHDGVWVGEGLPSCFVGEAYLFQRLLTARTHFSAPPKRTHFSVSARTCGPVRVCHLALRRGVPVSAPHCREGRRPKRTHFCADTVLALPGQAYPFQRVAVVLRQLAPQGRGV